MGIISEEIQQYAFEHTQDEGRLLKELSEATHTQLNSPQMLTGRVEGQFLKLLVSLLNAERVLEVGTFSGYSALSMAEGLPDNGTLVTCEIDLEHICFAKKFFQKSPHGYKISILEGPAIDSINSLEGPFDLAFIDADKINYLNYYQAIFPLMRLGGLIVVDNVLWGGRVLNPQEPEAWAIKNFCQAVSKDNRVDRVFLTVRDGIYCLRKK
ncbi:O-methyltransferase [Candidatus Riflebacteria bacterium]